MSEPVELIQSYTGETDRPGTPVELILPERVFLRDHEMHIVQHPEFSHKSQVQLVMLGNLDDNKPEKGRAGVTNNGFILAVHPSGVVGAVSIQSIATIMVQALHHAIPADERYMNRLQKPKPPAIYKPTVDEVSRIRKG